MKKSISALLFSFVLATTVSYAQTDKSTRPSPPTSSQATIASGAMVKINYSAPSVKGRTIGKDLEPMEGKVWRTGANEATVFTVSKDVTVEGKALPAGKYALFSIVNGSEWTFIFSKKANQWGAFSYKEAEDALRITVKDEKAAAFTEKLKIEVDTKGEVALFWGDHKATFHVK